jgi:acyl-CoA thioesterase-2
MDVALADLVACLALRPIGEGASEGANLDIGYHRVFGGQILAQVIVAAQAAAPDKSVKSLSVLFPREGDAHEPLRLDAAVAHEGRTFAAVEVRVSQASGDRTVATAVVSLHAEEGGLRHNVPPPQVGSPLDAPAQHLDLLPWDVRIVDGVQLAERTTGPATLTWWMRAPELERLRSQGTVPWPGSGMVDQALLAYATDLTLIGTALRPIEGFSQADSTVSLATAVTSHSIWFHEPFQLDSWLLVTQEAPVMAGARAFGHGAVFSGTDLVASFAQESMVRVIDRSPT